MSAKGFVAVAKMGGICSLTMCSKPSKAQIHDTNPSVSSGMMPNLVQEPDLGKMPEKFH